jgi:hypothetical protein
MGRRNRNVRRSNDKGRLARRERGQRPTRADLNIPRVSIEEMVIPTGKCFFRNRKGKAIFKSKQDAETALEQAQRNRARQGTGHVEKRYYSCPEGGCGGYHLSSREEYDPIKRTRPQREAS